MHPNKRIERDFFTEACADSGNVHLIIMMGDLNARTGLCQGEGWNDCGRKIIELFGFRVENDDSPTFYPSGGGSLASLDLCLIKSKAEIEVGWRVLDSVGSDHMPTELKIYIHSQGNGKKEIEIMNWDGYRKFWDKYEDQVDVPKNEKEIEDLTEFIKSKIEKARIENTGSKIVRFRGDLMLGKDTKRLIEMRRQLLKIRRAWKRNGKEDDLLRKVLNRMNKDVKICIKRDIDLKESGEASKLLEEKDTRKKWKIFGKMCGKRTEVGSCILKREGGSEAWSDLERAETHADRLTKSHLFPNQSYFNDNHRRIVDEELRI